MSTIHSACGYIYDIHHHLLGCAKYRYGVLLVQLDTVKKLLKLIAVDQVIIIPQMESSKNIPIGIWYHPQQYTLSMIVAFKVFSAQSLFKPR